jgi:PAS domain S-box-containing protein
LIVIVQDVTERKRAEEAFRLSEARFSAVFRASPAALGMGTVADGRMIDVNDRWLELFAYRREEVIGRSVLELSLWPDPKHREAVIRRLREEGVVLNVEVQFRRKSGEMRDALLSMVPVELPGGSEPVLVSMLTDVTDRRRAEAERTRLLEAERNARCEAEDAFERLRAIQSITDATLAHLGEEQLLRELLARLRSVLESEFASVRLIDEERKSLYLRAVDGVPFESIAGVRIPLDAASPITLDRPYIVNDLRPPAEGRHDWYAQVWSAVGAPLRYGMGAPLLVEGDPIGVVSVASTRRRFREEDMRLLQVVADRVAPTIEQYRLTRTVRADGKRLEALSRRLVQVQESERAEIARELHDEVGQLLTGLSLLIEDGDGANALPKREEMRRIVSELFGRVRDLSMNLRPPMLDPLGLLPALLWQIERFEAQTGIKVAFRHASLDRRFPSRVEITAFRIIQEALTNVARHAGVTKARLEVWADAASLGARIADEGRGFDVEAAFARHSSGLAGMRERSRLLGGELTIESAPGSGTKLSMDLPLSAVAGTGADE